MNLLEWFHSMAEGSFPRTLTQGVRVVIGFFSLGSILEGFPALHHHEIRTALWFFAVGAVVGILDIYVPRIASWIKRRPRDDQDSESAEAPVSMLADLEDCEGVDIVNPTAIDTDRLIRAKGSRGIRVLNPFHVRRDKDS